MGDKETRRDALEQEMNGPTFWNDQEKAKAIIQELKSLNAVLKPFEELGRQADDLEASLELSEESGNGEFDDEIRGAYAKALHDFEAFELRSMLGGPNDHCNAFVTIHAGAGGTEACDWAEMLLRMYLMWAESKGFATQITDREEGAPRASRSRPSTSMGSTPTAISGASRGSTASSGSARTTPPAGVRRRSPRSTSCPRSTRRSTSCSATTS